VDHQARAWFERHSSAWTDWPLVGLLEAKFRLDCRISLIIPARNEDATIGDIVATLWRTLVKDEPLLDQLVVIDSDSSDRTAGVAAAAGASVYRAAEIAPELGSHAGKGEALWKSLFVTDGDLLVFVDADLTRWGPHFVTGLLGPLLARPETQLVRAAYTRLRTEPGGARSPEGGRLTELVARPLLSLFWPELTGVVQPLAGEWAARRSLMESLSIPVGYGVELSTLIDTAATRGLDAIAQVHLGARAHRHRADRDLAVTAAELLAIAESRRHPPGIAGADLQQYRQGGQLWPTPVTRTVPVLERPPQRSLAGRPDAAGRPNGPAA
jgi:glucosyl-3-phosphoglycerate synthase